MRDYKTDNKSFPIYKDWEDIFNGLESNDEAGQLIKALFAYAKRGEEAKFKGGLKIAFIAMSQQIDRDGQKWEEMCNRNSINGKKGGAQRGKQECTQKRASGSTRYRLPRKQPIATNRQPIRNQTDP